MGEFNTDRPTERTSALGQQVIKTTGNKRVFNERRSLMETDYRIEKTEKGPLQRFKNQNLILQKFGQTGLKIYTAISPRRSAEQLRNDLGMDPDVFAGVLKYMEESGMVRLVAVEEEGAAKKTEEPEEKPEEIQETPETPPEPAEEEEISPELDQGNEETSEPPARTAGTDATEEGAGDGPREDEANTPEDERVGGDASVDEEGQTPPRFEADTQDEITPVDIDEGEGSGDEKGGPEDEKAEDISADEEGPGPEMPQENEGDTQADGNAEEPDGGNLEPEPPEITGEEEETPAEEESDELSPVEKIIKEKYGEVGIKVYALIDGQRTAEEIMKETGITEAKLVEILDFMDKEGIIKLEYPKKKKERASFAEEKGESRPAVKESDGDGGGEFAPIIDEKTALDKGEMREAGSQIEVPVRIGTDIVKSIQIKAKMQLKFGKDGSRVLDKIDGKKDDIEIALSLGMPLYTIKEMLDYLMGEQALLMKPVQREAVRKKYGDDAYAVYKKYGKEGVMLYELIGKEMTIKQMADLITKDRKKVVDMFLFVHQLLGIDLPIDKEILYRQLGVSP
ncbi:MAG: hypothetical protein ACP5NX_03200 [Candidatus Bilamarchaeaceae archaeon]